MVLKLTLWEASLPIVVQIHGMRHWLSWNAGPTGTRLCSRLVALVQGKADGILPASTRRNRQGEPLLVPKESRPGSLPWRLSSGHISKPASPSEDPEEARRVTKNIMPYFSACAIGIHTDNLQVLEMARDRDRNCVIIDPLAVVSIFGVDGSRTIQ
jgi:hypothetical protein